MKHLIDTIRAGLTHRREGEPYLSETPTAAALTALSELERMAGSQEPVAVRWCREGYHWTYEDYKLGTFYGRGVKAERLCTAAPPAQQPQYEAGDMASAAAQGFRDGVASVAQQPQAETDDSIAADAYVIACEEMEQWQHKRRKAGKEVGTTGSLCDGIAWLYGYIDDLEAKQPQAEAVPQTKQALADALYALQVPHVACQDGLVTRCMCRKCVIKRGDEALAAPQQAEAMPSSDLNPDEGDPVTLWAEIWRLREAVKGPDGYATWQDAATAERIRRVRAESKQAEEAKAVPTHDDTDLIKQMLEALRSCSGVSHWPALIPTINAARKRLETPQQAEAVPLFAALKVEGPRFHCAKVYGRIYQVLAVGSNKEDLLTVARLAKDAYYKQFPGTHEYKEPPFEWVVEEVPTAQPKFQPTEAVPPAHVLVPVEPTDEMLRAIRRQRSGARIGKGDRADWKVWLAAAQGASHE